MNVKIVSDSSSNILALDGVDFASVPMKIIAEKEYVDDETLDLPGMIEDLKNHKGRSGSSCPNVSEWLDAFGEADVVFGTTISGNLSGSFNSAREAARTYMEEHPGRHVCIVDSMSTGPEQAMLIDKFRQFLHEGLGVEEITRKVNDYHDHLHTLFCLESLTNLARNGRTNPAIAKIAGVLGIRVCGEGKEGRITPVHKARGPRKAIQTMAEMIKERGFYDGALLRIAHCFNPDGALALRDAILEEFPNARCILETTTALCSYYAEVGGLIVGFEGAYNPFNTHSGG